jgi:hypothetical protein
MDNTEEGAFSNENRDLGRIGFIAHARKGTEDDNGTQAPNEGSLASNAAETDSPPPRIRSGILLGGS